MQLIEFGEKVVVDFAVVKPEEPKANDKFAKFSQILDKEGDLDLSVMIEDVEPKDKVHVGQFPSDNNHLIQPVVVPPSPEKVKDKSEMMRSEMKESFLTKSVLDKVDYAEKAGGYTKNEKVALYALLEMGFTDFEVNIAFLKKHKFNVEAALEDLMLQ